MEENLNKEIEPDCILCIGDDLTDKDMFQVFQDDSLTIKVGVGLSDANFFYNLKMLFFHF